jgi:hypothetical protein
MRSNCRSSSIPAPLDAGFVSRRSAQYPKPPTGGSLETITQATCGAKFFQDFRTKMKPTPLPPGLSVPHFTKYGEGHQSKMRTLE